jgi:hypothetical protein
VLDGGPEITATAILRGASRRRRLARRARPRRRPGWRADLVRVRRPGLAFVPLCEALGFDPAAVRAASPGAAHGDEPRPPAARPEPARRDARRARARLRLVHRGLRRPAGGEDAARGARLSQEDSDVSGHCLAHRVQDFTHESGRVDAGAELTVAACEARDTVPLRPAELTGRTSLVVATAGGGPGRGWAARRG